MKRAQIFATLCFALTVIFFGAIPPSSADTVTLPVDDVGFVTEMGGSAKGDGTISPATFNYSVGREEHFDDGSLTGGIAYMERKNYFIFDLSGVTGPITSATLILWAGPDIGAPFPAPLPAAHGYESLDPSETFEIGETTDPGGALALAASIAAAAGGGAGAFDSPADPAVTEAKDLFTKLSDGPLVLGSASLSTADNGTFLAIPISPGGLGYVNFFVGGPILLSGTLPSATPPIVPPDPESQLVFGFSDTDVLGAGPFAPKLMVTFTPIPEPASAALTLMLIGFAVNQRRSHLR